MGLLPRFITRAPKRSNFSLSNKVRTDMPVGLLVPLRYDDTVPADQWILQVHALLKSFPALAPVMGAFKLQIDFFFCPWRNYMPEWLYNDRQSDLQNVELPYFIDVPKDDAVATNVPNTVAPNSLRDYLGFPVGYVNSSNATTESENIRFSALPFLMYYDIFRNYYANQQENEFYIMGGDGADNKTRPVNLPLSNIDNMLQEVREGVKDFSHYFGNEVKSGIDGAVMFDRHWKQFGGLVCRTYMPDQFTTLLNSQKIESIKQSTTIQVNDGSFTMDQLITARKGYRFLNNTAIAGSRYGEQIRAHFGVRTDDKLNIPQFLGSTSLRMTFDDVTSLSANNTGDPDSINGLGMRAGTGTVFGRNGKQYVNCTDYGTIMCIASIVPIVDYYQGISKFNLKTRMTDVFFPEFDGLGYQDVMRSELCALNGVRNGSYERPTSEFFNTAVGKQPAWLEYMTKDNRVHGEFTNTLRYWTITRDFLRKGTLVSSLPEAANFTSTSYIFPYDYTYLFSDQSNLSNFQLQVAFDVLAKRPISKQLTPTL